MRDLIPGRQMPGPNHPFWWILAFAILPAYEIQILVAYCEDVELSGFQTDGICRIIRGDPLAKK